MVQEAEELGKTVIEAFGESEMASQYRKLADTIVEICQKSE
jgi:nitrogenase iron protein NifH